MPRQPNHNDLKKDKASRMATTAIIARNDKRAKLISQHKDKRADYKKTIKDQNATPEVVMEAFTKLQKLPRNSSKVRFRNRCLTTGRANAVYRRFGLCRNEIRRLGHMGQIVGLMKSSW